MGHWEVERGLDVFGAFHNGSGKWDRSVDGLDVDVDAS